MSAEQEDSNSGFVAPEFREYALGTLGNVDHRDVHRHAGLVQDEQVERLLTRCIEAYEPLTPEMPASFWDTELAERIIKSEGTKTASLALKTGQTDALDYMSGLVNHETDISGWSTLLKYRRFVENHPVFIGYIWGPMGGGKTNFTMLHDEIHSTIYDNSRLVVNFEAEAADEEVNRWSRLLEIVEDRMEKVQSGEGVDDRLLIVIDEAAQIFSGSGEDQHRGKELAKLLKLIRRAKADVLLVGQDGKDIDASLRALCSVFIEKQSEKKMTFWRDVKNREGIGKMLDLSGVPATNRDYDPYDEGRFVFDDGEDKDEQEWEAEVEQLEREHERRMMAVLDLTSDVTQSDIASTYDVSEKTVRRARQEYEDELRSEGLV